MEKYLAIIQKASVFDGLAEAEITSALHCLSAATMHFQKGVYILHAGASPEAVGLLLSGSAYVVQEDFWGNRNIRAQIQPGQIFAEAFACIPGAVMDISVTAAEECTVMWLSVQRILHTCPTACAHHSRMIRNLLSVLAANNLRINRKLTYLSQRTTREKLLAYLSDEARRHGATSFTIPFNRQQLADFLSVERSAMAAELSRMQRDGLIRTHCSAFTLLETEGAGVGEDG